MFNFIGRVCILVGFATILIYINNKLYVYPPSSVTVSGKYYHIYYSRIFPNDLDKEKEEFGFTSGRVVGLTTCIDEVGQDHFIQVDPNESIRDLQDTVWHEVKHAASNCDDEPPKTYDDLFELQNPQELEVLRNNPALVAFLTRK